MVDQRVDGKILGSFQIIGESDVRSFVSMLVVTGLSVALALGGCTDSPEEPAAESPRLATPTPAGMVRGTVLETMDAGGYTYVLVETAEESRWIASQPTPVKVGDVVQTTQGMAMTGFQSKSLNRTFDTIHFVETLQNLSSQALPEGHPETMLPSGHPGPDETVPAQIADIAVAGLEAGQNIAWVYANKDSLAGQQIRLRGKVVKYNDGILGQNFIHIQDGSGDPASSDNDLTITSQGETAVGDTDRKSVV